MAGTTTSDGPLGTLTTVTQTLSGTTYLVLEVPYSSSTSYVLTKSISTYTPPVSSDSSYAYYGSISSTSSSTSSGGSPPPSPPPKPKPTPDPSPDPAHSGGGLKGGVIAGIVVAVVVLVALIVALALYAKKRRHRTKVERRSLVTADFTVGDLPRAEKRGMEVQERLLMAELGTGGEHGLGVHTSELEGEVPFRMRRPMAEIG